MKITIETIPHSTQRLADCGDWQWSGNDLNIRVSELGDFKSNAALIIHELTEAFFCKNNGITTETVDEWDIHNEKRGDDKAAPYHHEHAAATAIENLVICFMKGNWEDHCEKIDSL